MQIFIPTPTQNTFKELEGYSTLTQYLLNDRGFRTKKEAEGFMNPNYEEGVRSLFQYLDLDKASKRIKEAIENEEVIGIYSDYDCDGIPGAAALYNFFKDIYKEEKILHYTPDRNNLGFGIHREGLEELIKGGAKLIITIDCGSASFSLLEEIQKNGVDVIVIDHHLPNGKGEGLLAIINPFLNEIPPVDPPCAAGLVYLLILYMAESDLFNHKGGQEKWLLDLVGLSTIADMVPLVGTNRILARYGLEVLRKTTRPGIRALMETTKIQQPYLTEKEIAFSIAPRINAASRMGSAKTAFYLLTTDDMEEAYKLVGELEQSKRESKIKITNMMKAISAQAKFKSPNDNVWVFGNPNWAIAFAGLAAQRAVDKYERVVLVWGRDGQQNIKGSCRSYGGVDINKLMNECSECFSECGGHKKAGGFTLEYDYIHKAEEILNKSNHSNFKIGGKDMDIDAELLLSELSKDLIDEIMGFAPYGVKNKRPLLKLARTTITKIEGLGKTGIHTKYTFKENLSEFEGVHFFAKPTIPTGETVDIYAHIGKSGFGKTQLEIVKMEISAYN